MQTRPIYLPLAALAKAGGIAEASHLLCELEPPKDSEGRPLAGMAHAISLEGDSGALGWAGMGSVGSCAAGGQGWLVGAHRMAWPLALHSCTLHR